MVVITDKIDLSQQSVVFGEPTYNESLAYNISFSCLTEQVEDLEMSNQSPVPSDHSQKDLIVRNNFGPTAHTRNYTNGVCFRRCREIP